MHVEPSHGTLNPSGYGQARHESIRCVRSVLGKSRRYHKTRSDYDRGAPETFRPDRSAGPDEVCKFRQEIVCGDHTRSYRKRASFARDPSLRFVDATSRHVQHISCISAAMCTYIQGTEYVVFIIAVNLDRVWPGGRGRRLLGSCGC